ncbi:ShlB/FhaC/HecB family hemolysin secretion/activation protein [Henriciella aquimarina]|uniref:ShlB/FhaC/HecB family hemolysin secretion/activation protein n=1 Tax=Henriciella aquimarina TaxID=545261 RepID=UPI000A0587DC|nr:ShlB/FhaC/HecB family hemolysin secretion/activation protein [Henriciella aquimarina]
MTFEMRPTLLAVSLAACLVAPPLACGQELPDTFRDRLDPERERDQTALPERSAKLPSGSAEVDASGLTGGAISQINFEGTAVPARVAEAAEPFVGQALTRDTLEALVDALSDAYRKSDVALFTLVVPEQDFTNNKVRILVAEGYVQQVILSGDLTSGEQALIAAHADRVQEGRPTSRADLERNLLLLDDTPGLKVTEKVINGTKPAAVRLRLDAEQKRTDFSVGYDSRTTRLIDQGQVSGKAVGYGLFRAGDQTRLDLAASTDFDASRYAGLQHSTPIGTNGTRATAGAARLESYADDTGISGDAELYSLALSHPFIRSSKRNLRGILTLDALNSENAAFGSLLATERTRALRGTLSYDRTKPNRYTGISLKVSQGLDVLDARISQPVGTLDFLKAEASLKLVQRIAKQYYLRFNARGQWTDDPLPANERFSVGGPNYGRAFENGLINADTGASALVEAAYRPLRKGKFSKSEVYAFVDHSTVDFANRPIPSADLGSAGFGIRAAYDKVGQLGVEASRPYDEPVPGYEDDWQFAVNWRIRYDPR